MSLLLSDAEYLVFVYSRSLKMREKYTKWNNLVCLSFYISWAQSHLYLRKYFVKVNIDGSELNKYTNWDKLSSLDTLLAENNFPEIQSRYDCLGIPRRCRTHVVDTWSRQGYQTFTWRLAIQYVWRNPPTLS